MALTASLDLNATPPTLTVESDRRLVEVDVRSAGESTTAIGVWPVTVTDDERTWTVVSDDGTTAVYALA